MSLLNKLFGLNKTVPCGRCAFHDDGCCVREKLLIGKESKDSAPIFKREFVSCISERRFGFMGKCGPKAKHYAKRTRTIFSFEVGDTITDDDGFMFEVVYKPNQFVSKNPMYIVKAVSTGYYYYFLQSYVEGYFNQAVGYG